MFANSIRGVITYQCSGRRRDAKGVYNDRTKEVLMFRSDKMPGRVRFSIIFATGLVLMLMASETSAQTPVSKKKVGGIQKPASVSPVKATPRGAQKGTGSSSVQVGASSVGTAVSGPATPHGDHVITSKNAQLANIAAIKVSASDIRRRDIAATLNRQIVRLSDRVVNKTARPKKPNDASITVTEPRANDFWVAGKTYQIRWNSQNLNGPVKIDMVHAVSASHYDFYPVAARTQNDGTFNYGVPANLGTGPHNFYLQVSALDGHPKAFSPPYDVYHEPVDMTCMVVGVKQKHNTEAYPFYYDKDEYIEFYVWVRNNGTKQQLVVQTIKVLLVKEPEEVVASDIEFGFSNLSPHLWYKTNKPLKYHVRNKNMWKGTQVNLRKGAYRVEVIVDPLNRLGEDPANREDNRHVARFEIK